jgi:hypothetical protein
MGFDWQRFRMLRNGFTVRELSLASFQAGDITVVSNHPAWNGNLNTIDETFHFKPHFGWIGAIESQRRALEA